MTGLTNVKFGFVSEAKGQIVPWVDQVHGTQMWEARSENDEKPLGPGDAVFTIEPNLPVYIFTADCLPLLLASEDPAGPVAAIHSGWKGTKDGIISRAVERLGKPEQMHAIIGPCIRVCCFEVRSDFIEAFEKVRGPIAEFIEERNAKTYFDLDRFVVERELLALSPDHVHRDFLRCTVCSSPELPSYRRNGHTLQRIRAWIERV